MLVGAIRTSVQLYHCSPLIPVVPPFAGQKYLPDSWAHTMGLVNCLVVPTASDLQAAHFDHFQSSSWRLKKDTAGKICSQGILATSCDETQDMLPAKHIRCTRWLWNEPGK